MGAIFCVTINILSQNYLHSYSIVYQIEYEKTALQREFVHICLNLVLGVRKVSFTIQFNTTDMIKYKVQVMWVLTFPKIIYA